MKLILNLGLLFLGGCASIISGSYDVIEVKSSPSGAKVLVVGNPTSVNSYANGNVVTTEVPNKVAFTINTPARLTLSKKDLWQLYIQKPGYQTEVITIFKEGDSNIWWNAFNLFLFLPVDFASGAANCAQRTEYNVRLDKK